MKIVYLSNQFESSGIYASQVAPICEEHASNLDFELLVFDRSLNKPLSETRGKLKIKRLRGLPFQYLPIFNFLQAILLSKTTLIRSADIVHCRGHFTASAALFCRSLLSLKYKVVADIRGAVVQEQLMKGGALSRFYAFRALALERYVFRAADYFLFVSEEMETYYQELYGKRKSQVIPTIVNKEFFRPRLEKRQELRESMNLLNKVILIYVGGVSVWQNIETMIDAFAKLTKKRNDIFMFFVSKDAEELSSMIKLRGIPDSFYKVLSLEYQDIPIYLNSADFGVLIRDDNTVNRVASPTKLNEYLACNLKVITSGSDMNNLRPTPFSKKIVDTKEATYIHSKIYFDLMS